MNTDSVLCGVDFSGASESALEIAAQLARRTGRQLLLVHAVPPAFSEVVLRDERRGALDYTLAERAAEVERSVHENARRALVEEAARLSGLGIEVRVRVAEGSPAEALLAAADETNPAYIVVGTHGRRAPARWILGSVAERLVRELVRPVIVVPPLPKDRLSGWTQSRPLRVCVSYDFGEPAARAVEHARSLARTTECDLTFLHAYWPPAEASAHGFRSIDPEGSPDLERLLSDDVRARLGAGAGRVVVRPAWGRAPDAVATWAADTGSDLLVVGSQARSALVSLLEGSFSRGVIRRPTVPVLCIPPAPDEETRFADAPHLQE